VLTSAEQQAKVGSSSLHRGLSDEELLKKLLEDHHRWTGSKRARELLDTWAQSRLKFVKVFPLEYQRALKEMGQASASTQAKANASPSKASKTSKAST
jgi:glutamate synthase domain-containing protein 3